ncbi:CMRF35-like molecule 1 [Rhynchocyon petersi]
MRGPSAVTGREGGSLTVKCDYDPGYEKYVKWWCRGAAWGPCRILVKTTGSEQEVKNNRISIKDRQEDRTFTVTMELLRKDDADVYWCGIEKTGTDLGAKVKVSVDPAAGTPSEQAFQPLEGDLCYANLTLNHNSAPPGSSQKKASTKSTSSTQAAHSEVEYVTMGPFPKVEVSYAALSLATPEQELTYGNVGYLPAQAPTGSQEETTEYSTIRKT